MPSRKNHIGRQKIRRQGALERLQNALRSSKDEKAKKRMQKEIETLQERINTYR